MACDTTVDCFPVFQPVQIHPSTIPSTLSLSTGGPHLLLAVSFKNTDFGPARSRTWLWKAVNESFESKDNLLICELRLTVGIEEGSLGDTSVIKVAQPGLIVSVIPDDELDARS